MKIRPFSIFNFNKPLTSAVVVVFCLSALLLVIPRFFVFPRLCSRALECASLYRAPAGPFHRKFFFEKNSICGDLSTMTDAPGLCAPRSEIFQTDQWGYRNDDGVASRNGDILIFGDSFVFGAGLTQEDDPASQLSRVTGRAVFNGAGKLELNFLRWQLENLDHLPKVVVYFHLERHHLSSANLKEWDQKIHQGLAGTIETFWETFSRYNPLKIVAGKIEKKWFIPNIFPNRFAGNAPLFSLKNGAPFLFLPSSVDQYGDPRTGDLPLEGSFFSGLKEILAKKNIKLLVVLLPEKFTVYASLLADPPKSVETGPDYLDHLEVELHQRNLDCVNMVPIFKGRAAESLEKNEYIYYPDDSHWNPAGVKIMADELKKSLIYF